MYSTAWGRFNQPDAIGYAGGSHLYRYVANDPLNLTDPLALRRTAPSHRLAAEAAMERSRQTLSRLQQNLKTIMAISFWSRKTDREYPARAQRWKSSSQKNNRCWVAVGRRALLVAGIFLCRRHQRNHPAVRDPAAAARRGRRAAATSWSRPTL